MSYKVNSTAKSVGDAIKLIAYTVLGAGQEAKYKQPKFIENSAEDSLYKRLTAMIDNGHINEAENTLFDSLDITSMNYLQMSLAIYYHINEFDDDYLENNGFSREEVQDGIGEITKLYSINGLAFMTESL